MSKYSNVNVTVLANTVSNAINGLVNDNLSNISSSLSNDSVFNGKASIQVNNSIAAIEGNELVGSKGRLKSKLSNLSTVAAKISLLQSKETEVSSLTPGAWVYESVLKGYEMDDNNHYKTDEKGWLIPIYEKENVYHENDQAKINALNGEISSLETEIDALLT